MRLPKELNTVTPLSKYLAMVVFVALPIVGFFLGMRYQEMTDFDNNDKDSSMKACTEEAKICPDGSYVGRQGPNCEFSACPNETPDETANWKTYTNTKFSFSFQYPSNSTVKEQIILDPKKHGLFIDEQIQILVDTFDYNGESLNKPIAENIIIDGQKARKYNGISINEEDKLDQTMEHIVIPFKEYYYHIIAYELKTDEPHMPNRMINPMPKSTSELFEQILSTFKFTDQLSNKNPKIACEEKGGTWLETYKECDGGYTGGLDESSCTSLGGKFTECDSPCRHDPKAEVCTTVCVRVCKF